MYMRKYWYPLQDALYMKYYDCSHREVILMTLQLTALNWYSNKEINWKDLIHQM